MKALHKKTALFFACLLAGIPVGLAQSKGQIEIIQAGSLQGYREKGEEVRKLVGQVVFAQGTTRMYCDSALFFEKRNAIDAAGNVRIVSPSATAEANTLHYEGSTEQATLNGNVRLSDGKMLLTTEALSYDVAGEVGYYENGGKVTDPTNVLTSRKGRYLSREKMVFFRDQVELVNPRYVMNSDTLKYHTPTATAYFLGPCTIRSSGKDSTRMYCEYGWYNTQTNRSYFSRNAWIQSSENRLSGDSLLFDRNAGIGQAWGSVKLEDSVQKVMITGDYGWMNERSRRSYISGRPEIIRSFATDSLFIHADTLYAQEDSANGFRTYFAYPNVRMYKSDLQGKCDSLVFSTGDSLVKMFGVPLLWSDSNQISGEHIELFISGNQLGYMDITTKAFIASREDSLRFSQISGRDMRAYFVDNALNSIRVRGNGQSIYYVRNGDGLLTGMNKAECSDMLVSLEQSKIKKIALLQAPDAVLYPVRKISPSEALLRGFLWQEEKRPKNRADIFNWR